jgi:dihydroorotase
MSIRNYGRRKSQVPTQPDQITITRPDDWHLHLRDGACLAAVLPDTARQFARAIVMPNLLPPVTSVASAAAYRDRILAALPNGMHFEPLMTLYLTETTSPADIAEAKASGFVHAVKYYPAGATTHSDAGVNDLARCSETLAAMAQHDLPLLMHGEVTDPSIDIFDRERAFIETQLEPAVRKFPELRIVLEHITTRDAVAFVERSSARVAATITAHHLLLNRNHMFIGGIRPQKRETHRQALLASATGGNPKFFLGTDSAPHARNTKETSCGCAGVYTAHAAIELYAEAFDSVGRLDRLEAFASHHGPDFYELPRNSDRITLERSAQRVPSELPFGDSHLVPMRAGEDIAFSIAA